MSTANAMQRNPSYVRFGPRRAGAEPDPQCATVMEHFADRVRAHPDDVAVLDGTTSLTYRMLDAHANGIAGRLLEQGLEAGQRVAIACAHEAGMVAAVLGVLKAALAYVPIDPGQPASRNAEIVADAGARVIVTDAASREHAVRVAESRQTEVIDLAGVAPDPCPPSVAGPRAEDLAYILYTSGSTGRPKGVAQTHAYLVGMSRTFATSLHLGRGDRIALLASLNFSASVMDIFAAVLAGASLRPIDVKRRGFDGLRHDLHRDRITVYHSVPTLFRCFARALPADAPPFDLRLVYLAGEPLLRSDFELFAEHAAFGADCRLVNGLGTTEFNICRQRFLAKDSVVDEPVVSVGWSSGDAEVDVLDDDGNLVEWGKPGEIAVSSAHLEATYWNAPEQTRARFCADPSRPGQRLFRTGDIGVLGADGDLQHLGRKDEQLKIRGQRVEPGEVHSALLRVDGVEDAGVVGVRLGGATQLHGFFTASRRLHVPTMRVALRRCLPDAMVPASLRQLDAMPRTATGKLDRRALVREAERPLPRAQPRASQSVRRSVSAIVAAHLRAPRVELDLSLFDAGGNSLTAMQIAATIQKELGAKVGVVDVFTYPTIRSLAAHVERLVMAPSPVGVGR